jgi:predicted transposase/invertase (TIGR01784 family)
MSSPITFNPEDDIVDICRDSVFKTTFTRPTPSSQRALKCLISALIESSVEVLDVVANELPAGGGGNRQTSYDLTVRFDRDKVANIEITLTPRNFETVRIEYCAARLYTNQVVGSKKKNLGGLSDTYQISIVGGKRLFNDDAAIHHFEYYDSARKVIFGGQTKIIIVELEKAEGLLAKPVAEMSAAERWTVFFRYVGDPRKRAVINEIVAAEEGVAMAGEDLLTISRDEAERARFESEFKYELDRQCELVDARRDGLAEGERIGLEKGRAEQKRETVRRLKAMGLPPDQIAQATGLDPEETA